MKRKKGLKPGKWRTSKHIIKKRAERKGFEAQWRRWQFECYAEFLWGDAGLAILKDEGKDTLPCERCGKIWQPIEADHAAIPRSNRLRGDPWDPANGQILDHDCNSEKGSSHGPKWDFRTTERKIHQMQKASVDWNWNGISRDWEYIGSSKFVTKGGKHVTDR